MIFARIGYTSRLPCPTLEASCGKAVYHYHETRWHCAKVNVSYNGLTLYAGIESETRLTSWLIFV